MLSDWRLKASQRLLLPRITGTLSARRSLRTHHFSLLRRLTTSLAALKESQAESFSVLPRPANPWKEFEPFSKCRTVQDILDVVAEQKSAYSQLPHVTLLRCGIRDLSAEKGGQPTTAELFGYLERQISWLTTDDGLKFEVLLLFLLVLGSTIKIEYRKDYGIPSPRHQGSIRVYLLYLLIHRTLPDSTGSTLPQIQLPIHRF